MLELCVCEGCMCAYVSALKVCGCGYVRLWVCEVTECMGMVCVHVWVCLNMWAYGYGLCARVSVFEYVSVWVWFVCTCECVWICERMGMVCVHVWVCLTLWVCCRPSLILLLSLFNIYVPQIVSEALAIIPRQSFFLWNVILLFYLKNEGQHKIHIDFPIFPGMSGYELTPSQITEFRV
jgi:hypothetical protein